MLNDIFGKLRWFDVEEQKLRGGGRSVYHFGVESYIKDLKIKDEISTSNIRNLISKRGSKAKFLELNSLCFTSADQPETWTTVTPCHLDIFLH